VVNAAMWYEWSSRVGTIDIFSTSVSFQENNECCEYKCIWKPSQTPRQNLSAEGRRQFLEARYSDFNENSAALKVDSTKRRLELTAWLTLGIP
jgi:hypothetical protein